jgi:MoaA/NifB/PqqE/SkfB family radical SAM enzyme
MTNPPIFRVGLLLTERCDAACRHCWFSSSPDRNTSMTLEQAKRYVDEAAANGARWVSFTGGEPFLVYGLLRDLTAHASGIGLLNEAVTNCNWATSSKKALELLYLLRDSGLDTLNMSVDDFHQETIPLERVRNCYEAAKRLGLKPVFMMAVKKGSVITADNIREIMEDPSIQVLGGERVPNPSALAMETHFTPVGRGEKIPRHELRYIHVESEPCRQVLTDIGVQPNGDVMPCCGPLGAQGDAVIGNLEEESLREMLERAWLNPRLRRIYETGPRQLDGSYVSRCHMCVEAYRKDMGKEGPC